MLWCWWGCAPVRCVRLGLFFLVDTCALQGKKWIPPHSPLLLPRSHPHPLILHYAPVALFPFFFPMFHKPYIIYLPLSSEGNCPKPGCASSRCVIGLQLFQWPFMKPGSRVAGPTALEKRLVMAIGW